jgi:hypothetical protein
MQWRYGIKEYLEGGIDGSVFEIIEVTEGEDRGWGGAFTFSDSLSGVTGLMEMIIRDIKDLKQPDVTTTLYEWWWTDTPDVKYPTGIEEDEDDS